MIDGDLRGIATTAKLGGHPIHPMLIPFPIALLVATLASDVAYWGTGDAFWARGSFWLLAAALVMSAAAAAAGFADFFGSARIRSTGDAWQHMIANLAAVVLALVNFTCAGARSPLRAFCPGASCCRQQSCSFSSFPVGKADRSSITTGSACIRNSGGCQGWRRRYCLVRPLENDGRYRGCLGHHHPCHRGSRCGATSP